MTDEDRPPALQAPPEPLASNDPLTVLVVDDDAVDRMALRRTLASTGIEAAVREADSVATAEAVLAENSFHVAFVDYHLPDGDGAGVLAGIRRLPRPPSVIMLTGQGDERLAVSFMKEGAADYLPKEDLSAATLERSLRYVLARRRAEVQEQGARTQRDALAEAGERFAHALEVDETMEALAGLLVPRLGDGVRITLTDSDGKPWRDLERGRWAAALAGAPAVSTAPSGGATEVATHYEWSAPLRAAGRAIGAVVLFRSPARGVLGEAESALATSLVARGALALENARLYAELREETESVALLNRIGRDLTRRLDADSIAEHVLAQGRRVLDAEAGVAAIPVHEPGAGISFRIVRSRGEAGHAPRHATGHERDLIEHLLETLDSASATVSNLPTHGAGAELLGPDRPCDAGAGVAVPLGRRPEETGILLLAVERDVAIGSRQRGLLEGLGAWAGIALVNAGLLRRAEAAVRARDEVIGVVSHDLRNPLNVILSASELVLDLELPPDRQKEQLRAIQRSGRSMNRLIQDLLDVTRVEGGGLTIERTRCDLNGLLAEVEALLEPMAASRGIELVRERGDERVAAAVDRDRIIQVFSNLIGNSLKFTPGGGRISFGARQDGADVVLCVEDTGQGIADDQIPHLFDRFWQARRGDREGAGLGLPIVKGIVDAHGGSIDVRSEVGAGTRVTIRLPAA